MAFVDALRGLAAGAVLLFHLLRNSPQFEVLDRTFPDPVKFVIDYCRNGVAVFFVISGFVIGYSLKAVESTRHQFGRFMLRRQARLDPPYWTILAMVVIISLIERMVPSLVSHHFDALDVLANVFYLQGVLHREQLFGVSWTLCLEVQFYLVLLLLLYATKANSPQAGVASGLHLTSATVAVATASGLMSMVFYVQGLGYSEYFLGTWYFFIAGLLCCWWMLGAVHDAVFGGYILVFASMCVSGAIGVVGADPWRGEWFGLATVATLAVLAQTGRLSLTCGRLTQWLGRISYSLYLVHLLVIDTVMAVAFKVTGQSRVGALLGWVAGLVGSLVAAVILHRFIEQPSNALSKRLKTMRPSAAVRGVRLDLANAWFSPTGRPRPAAERPS